MNLGNLDKRTLYVLLAFALFPGKIQTSSVMTLKGTVFSVLSEEFVMQSGRELFYIKKDALPSDQRKRLEKASAHEITVDIPMNAITRVRSSQDEIKKPAADDR